MAINGLLIAAPWREARSSWPDVLLYECTCLLGSMSSVLSAALACGPQHRGVFFWCSFRKSQHRGSFFGVLFAGPSIEVLAADRSGRSFCVWHTLTGVAIPAAGPAGNGADADAASSVQEGRAELDAMAALLQTGTSLAEQTGNQLDRAVPPGMQYRSFRLYIATMHRILVPVMGSIFFRMADRCGASATQPCVSAQRNREQIFCRRRTVRGHALLCFVPVSLGCRGADVAPAIEGRR
jgi:hypothetical protein